jgi:glycosyltransferase involved in cell wall biosynthesis
MPPRSVFATSDTVGGVWTYALDLAQGLAAQGIATTLAILGPGPDRTQIAQAETVPDLRWIETGLPLDWTAESPAMLAAAGRALGAFAAASDAVLVHLNAPAFAAARPFRQPVVGVLHSCLATWWQAVRTGPLPEDFAWRTEMLREGLAACGALITPSAAYGERVASVYALPRPFIVHNGRSPSAAAQPRARKPIAITAGRLWDAGKNVGVLDAAAQQLAAPLVAIGPLVGPNGERVALRHAQPLGAMSATELRAQLAEASVFVSAASYEPFGLTVLEAAQAGCALLLADIPTFRELWNGAARFVPAENSAAFSSAIQRLLDDPDECRRRGAAAQRRAEAYTMEATVRGVLDVYRRVAPDLMRNEAGAAA